VFEFTFSFLVFWLVVHPL